MRLFPRSADRGPIEAALLPADAGSAATDFRDQLIAAPLKHFDDFMPNEISLISAIS